MEEQTRSEEFLVHRDQVQLGCQDELETLRTQGHWHWVTGEKQEAFAAWLRVLEVEPYDVQTLLQRARALQESQLWALAVQDLSRLLSRSPQLARAYLYRSECYAAWGKTALAISDALQALRCAEPGMPDIPKLEQHLKALKYRGPTTFPLPESPSCGEWFACIEPLSDAVFSGIQGCYEQAKHHVKLGEFDLSVSFWSTAIELDPSLFESYIGRANSYRMLGQLEAALFDLKHAIRLCPKSDHAFHQRALVHWESGDVDEAIRDLQEAIDIFPFRADYYSQCALFFLSLGQDEQAMSYLSRAVELDPTDTTSLFHLATLLYQSGAWQQAISSLEQLLSIVPHDADALVLLGDVHARSEHWKKAIDVWMQAIPLRLDDVSLYVRMARANHCLQQQAQAWEAWLIALEWFVSQEIQDPAVLEGTDAWFVDTLFPAGVAAEQSWTLLEMLLDAAEEQRVLGVLQTLLSHLPQHPGLWCLQARALQGLGESTQATEAYRRACSLEPQQPNTWHHWGCFLLEQGCWSDGIAALGTVLTLTQAAPQQDPDDLHRTYLAMGTAFKKRMLWQNSADALQRSLSLRPEQPLVWLSLGEVYEAMKQPEQAIHCYSRSLLFEPELAMAWYSRACMYGQCGKKQEALRDLRQAIARNARYQVEAVSHPSFSQWLLPDSHLEDPLWASPR